MRITCKILNRRALTGCVLIAISLLSAGCHGPTGHGFTSRCFRCLVDPPVCPTCHAKTIDQCQCFAAAENAGYCETTWAPLEAMMYDAPIVPTYSEHDPQIPLPTVPVSATVDQVPVSDSGFSSLTDVAPTDRQWQYQNPTALDRSPAVSVHVVDGDDAQSDYYRTHPQ